MSPRISPAGAASLGPKALILGASHTGAASLGPMALILGASPPQPEGGAR